MSAPSDRLLGYGLPMRLRRWLGAVVVAVATGPMWMLLAAPYTNHWAFQPLASPTPPQVRNTEWPRGPVDRFILARLESNGLRPAPDADALTWLRRVTFDLTGLPPTQKEILEFSVNPGLEAKERVVDRLLNSPAYGERWARHWLDLVGYADQLGTVNDVPAPYAWRYRDYVIRSLNSDKPFDRFAHEQIAGDLLPLHDAQERQDALVATGFLLLGEIHIVTGDKVQLRADIVDHQIQKVGTAFLGQTLGCVRCHDHKFDPIGLEDYYGMAGIFNSTESSLMTDRGVWSTLLTSELPETPDQRLFREAALSRHQARVAELRAQRKDLSRQLEELKVLSKKPAGPATSAVSGDKPPTLQTQISDLEKKIAQIDTRQHHLAFIEPRAAVAHTVRESERPADGQIHQRGNARALGKTVTRGFIRAIQTSTLPEISSQTSGRLELARWLTMPDHPVTARVAANRVWQHVFGTGLVRSVDYFGTRGEQPSHPELLDWLAREFMRRGWSQKALLRELVLSRTYGIASAQDGESMSRDPDNRLLSRMNRRRLDAESLRDAILSTCGSLQAFPGGPALALHLLENVGGLDPKDPNPISFRTSVFPTEQHRWRTVYLPVVRSRAQPGPAELRNLFDFVPPTEMTGKRPSTSVATQALFLLNGEFMKTHASKLADLALSDPGASDRERLSRLYLRVLNRTATPADLDRGEAFLRLPPEDSKDPRRAAWTELCHALLSSNEFLYKL